MSGSKGASLDVSHAGLATAAAKPLCRSIVAGADDVHRPALDIRILEPRPERPCGNGYGIG